MFSKFPQKLTAPFGLLGDEAKLAFPSQPGGISKLWTVRVRTCSSTGASWWLTVEAEYLGEGLVLGTGRRYICEVGRLADGYEQYFILFDSASDVFSLITPHQSQSFATAPETCSSSKCSTENSTGSPRECRYPHPRRLRQAIHSPH